MDSQDITRDLYCQGRVLDVIQGANLFPDSKTFVDMYMKVSPEEVLASFSRLGERPSRSALENFLETNFVRLGEDPELQPWNPEDWTEKPGFLADIKVDEVRSWGLELNRLWKVLGRKIADCVELNPERHSLLPLPKPFVIPGDRFREIYYWDTYFILGGLLVCGMSDTARDMIQNLLSLLDRYGFIPNGGRLYYTNRSQPPLLAMMLDMYVTTTGDLDFARDNLSLLEKEHGFWINERSIDVTCPNTGDTHRLARYSVDISLPRPEGYVPDRKDMEGLCGSETRRLLSSKASACESGWDFSSRWMSDYRTMATLATSQIVPVDLNTYLCVMEQVLAKLHQQLGNNDTANHFGKLADRRRRAMDALLWDDGEGCWFDWDLVTSQPRRQFFPSNVFPLLYKSTSKDLNVVGEKIIQYIKPYVDRGRHPGGVPTSMTETGEQWDYPSVWPPLVYLLVQALRQLPQQHAATVARDVAMTMLRSMFKAWKSSGHMYEKYDARHCGKAGGGGEYGVQVGFGWSNGVALMLLQQYKGQLDDLTKDYS